MKADTVKSWMGQIMNGPLLKEDMVTTSVRQTDLHLSWSSEFDKGAVYCCVEEKFFLSGVLFQSATWYNML